MEVNGVNYAHTIEINDLNAGLYVAQCDENKYLDRLVGGITYDKNGKFSSMKFAINYGDNEQIIKKIYEYEVQKFLIGNMDRLFSKFILSESDMFFKMNLERINAKYLNDDTVKNIEEIKGEI